MDKPKYYIELTPKVMEEIRNTTYISDLQAMHVADLVIDGQNKVIKSRHYALPELNSFDFVEKDPKPKSNRTRVDALEINNDWILQTQKG